MSLHPQVIAHLARLVEMGAPKTHESTVEVARSKMPMLAALTGSGPTVQAAYGRRVPVEAGEIPVRIYDPHPNPGHVIVWLHGGGWVMGDVEDFDASCQALAAGSAARVVSVGYRLAPEHKYPVAVQDCLAAIQWVTANLLPAGGGLIIGGESTGANLAAVCARYLRDEGGVQPRLQVLVYPVTDHDFSRPSYKKYGTGLPLTAADMQWFWDHYLPDVDQRDDPDASPLRAADLVGLPPARIVLAEYDVLRDEASDYAQRLEAAGVEVTVDLWNGSIHGFFAMVGYFELADHAMAGVCAAIRRALDSD